MRKFMVDIETTGVDLAVDEILQIAFLELNFTGKIWETGRHVKFHQRTDKQPTSEFAIKHMKELYDFCNMIPFTPVAEIREKILAFFKECGANPPSTVFLAGNNAPLFDIPFLVRDGYIQKNRYDTVNGKDVMVGDFHYRVFDLNTALDFAQQLTGRDRKDLIEQAKQIGGPGVSGKAHDALDDCYSQTRMLNGLLQIVRGEG